MSVKVLFWDGSPNLNGILCFQKTVVISRPLFARGKLRKRRGRCIQGGEGGLQGGQGGLQGGEGGLQGRESGQEGGEEDKPGKGLGPTGQKVVGGSHSEA